jgi:signal transduction histidine kinase
MPDRGLIYAVARDITEEKNSQEVIARQARELERSNTDLEQFAYTASHDLRSPLHAVAQITELIEKDLPAEAPARVRENLRQMRDRLQRMESLTEDLLQYSRAVRATEKIVPVDTAKLISELTFLLAPPEGFTVTPEPGMPVFATVKSPLELVFRNLLGNALKHHDRREGRIAVSARERGGFFEFSVADDGPGIEPGGEDKIFEMFRKGKAGIKGTGLGLALVRRIVERTGGRVWVEPGGKRGAIFRFTWPKRLNDGEEIHADHSGGG